MGPRTSFVVFGSLLLSPLIVLGSHDFYLHEVYSGSGSVDVIVSGIVEAPGHIFPVTFLFGYPFGVAVASSDVVNQTAGTAVFPFSGDFVMGQYSVTIKNGQTYSVSIEYMSEIRETNCNAATLNLNVLSDHYMHDVYCN